MLRRERRSHLSAAFPRRTARDERVNVIRKGRQAKRKIFSGFLFVRICLTSRAGEGSGIMPGMSDRCDAVEGGRGGRGAGKGRPDPASAACSGTHSRCLLVGIICN